jgi:hypothetical protein
VGFNNKNCLLEVGFQWHVSFAGNRVCGRCGANSERGFDKRLLGVEYKPIVSQAKGESTFSCADSGAAVPPIPIPVPASEDMDDIFRAGVERRDAANTVA